MEYPPFPDDWEDLYVKLMYDGNNYVDPLKQIYLDDPDTQNQADPLPGSDIVINSESGVQVSEAPVGQISDPISGCGSLMADDPVEKISIQEEVGEISASDGSDPVDVPESDPFDVPESDPFLGSHNLMAALGADLVDQSFKRKRTKRPRGGWVEGCRSNPFHKPVFRLYPIIGGGAFNGADANPLEVEGALVHKRSGGKRTKRSRRGAKRPSWLPEGWTVTCKTRRNGASAGVVDKYYVEPVTLKRFRSKIQVKRHLKVGT